MDRGRRRWLHFALVANKLMSLEHPVAVAGQSQRKSQGSCRPGTETVRCPSPTKLVPPLFCPSSSAIPSRQHACDPLGV